MRLPVAIWSYCFGLVQALQAPPSRRHWNVALARSDEKVNFGVRFSVLTGGVVTIVVSGALSLQVYEAGVTSHAPNLQARTWKVWSASTASAE
ncbi:MAG: hypothetical protein ACOYL9_15325 [Ilumatobacteraceae bacterium]